MFTYFRCDEYFDAGKQRRLSPTGQTEKRGGFFVPCDFFTRPSLNGDIGNHVISLLSLFNHPFNVKVIACIPSAE